MSFSSSRRRRARAGVALSMLAGLALGNPAAAQQGTVQPQKPAQWRYFPQPPAAPAGAPNVLLILSDDVGFGASSTFGGPVATPTFDALAAEGLRYNAFHTTAMCSPTRAALLTGRNHHAVASGSIADVAVDAPGYTSVIPKSAATVARVLKDHGYDTAMVGKNHNTPTWENSLLGPFDNWPNGWGFDYFYGFNGPFADQFHPSLVENRNTVRPPDTPGYFLENDLADHLIQWLRAQHNLRPDHPFFAYYASGATHAPHHVPAEWIGRFKGRFDQGWDKLREETFARQKRMGVIPANAVLTSRPAGLPAWESLSPEMKRAYSHMMEVAAAQLAYFDDQIGRVVAALRATGELDNTMVIYIQGDNGASTEDLKGSTQELRTIAGFTATDADLIRDIDKHGGPESFPNYPAAWAWATNAPFQWGKRVASHLGGLRDGMVISWPKRIKQVGQIRGQFGHVTDIAPTIYEVAGITPPATVDGVPQQPIDGVSLAYTFDQAKAPSRHREQYFEMLGNRAYYKDGWMASTIPGNPSWEPTGKVDPNTFQWALYDLNTDWSQSKDVSARYPGKLAELKADFEAAAMKYNVYPLDADLVLRMGPGRRPSLVDGRTSFTYYPGDTRYTATAFPALAPGWTISAAVTTGPARSDGTIFVQGDHFGGQGLLIRDGMPTYVLNPGDMRQVVLVRAAQPLAPGRHLIEVAFMPATGPGAATTIDLRVDGKSVGSVQTRAAIRGRGDAYVGRAGIAPLLDGPEWASLPPACECNIDRVTIERNADAR